ncbi:MAG: nicotinate (nicotinamide) nucleotide adenylyltransferase [Flavobacteriaceae bacterium]
MKKIGLYFGSFNPIHIGHLVIANHIAEHSNLDEIWLVVTPHNPFKKKKTLLDDHHRMELVNRACEGYEKIKGSDIEFKLPQPNYTINTLVYLKEKFPEYQFCLLMGEDNLNTFHKWKNYEEILKEHPIYVYPRKADNDQENQFTHHPDIVHIDAPIMEISSTHIRKAIKAGKNVRPLLPTEVWNYIDEMNFYRK